MTISTTRRERERPEPKPHEHRIGWQRQRDGRIQVRCTAGDFTITLDRHVTPQRIARYGAEHRAIVKRIAQLQAAGR